MFPDLGMEIHNILTILPRVLTAFLAGCLIGWERESYVDLPFSRCGSVFRTYALVCLGSCLFTVSAQFGFKTDRVAAQIVSGVGFLGAGVILKDHVIKGVPTATGIWVSAAIGMLFGGGLYISGFMATILTYFIMDLPHRFPQIFTRHKLKYDSKGSTQMDEDKDEEL